MPDLPPSAMALDAELVQDVAATFGMLAATARLQIVWLLADGERDVGTLATELGQSVAAVSQHLAKLRLAGLVRSHRSGRRQIYLVDDPHVIDMVRLAVDHQRGGEHAPVGRRSSIG